MKIVNPIILVLSVTVLGKSVEKSLSNNRNIIKDILYDEVIDDNSENYIYGLGSNFSDVGILVPANFSLLNQSGISPDHLIGYVPLNTKNGEVIVIPAGAISINDEHLLDVSP